MKRWTWAAMATIALCSQTEAGPVYKCTVNGKTAYSDAPCVGAKEVDIQPTEGMNKWTGSERKSPDQVQRDMTKARRDLPSGHFESRAKYSHLRPSDQRECHITESEIAALKAAKPVNEQALYSARAKFFKLKC